jgi:hypothetical protein
VDTKIAPFLVAVEVIGAKGWAKNAAITPDGPFIPPLRCNGHAAEALET